MADRVVPTSEQILAYEQYAENVRKFREDGERFSAAFQALLAQAETEALRRQWEIENKECSLP